MMDCRQKYEEQKKNEEQKYKERLARIRYLRFERSLAKCFVESHRYNAAAARRHADKLDAIANDAEQVRTPHIEPDYQTELMKLGREANADRHVDTWLDSLKGLPLERKAKAIRGLLNVAEDTIREDRIRRDGDTDSIVFLGQCMIYAQRYSEELKRIGATDAPASVRSKTEGK